MTTNPALFWTTVGCIAAVAFLFAGVAIVSLCNAADENKRRAVLDHLDRLRREKEKRMRIIQTNEGDTLRDGIRRAFVLSHEHGPTCLIHDGTPIIVCWESTPQGCEAEWSATRKVQLSRRECNGAAAKGGKQE